MEKQNITIYILIGKFTDFKDKTHTVNCIGNDM